MSKRKILWIEDERDWSDQMIQFFGGKYNIVFAQNNEKALEILRNHQGDFDLLVTDLHLGSKVEGGAFIQQICDSYPILPIVVVTKGAVSEIMDAIKAGAKDVLAKAEINAERWAKVFDTYATPKIFLSHSSADKNTVKQITQLLGEYGINVWFDRSDISVGDSISTTVSKKLEESNIVLAYFSEHSTSSEWMENELENIRQQFNRGKKIIPIVSDISYLPGWLKDTFCIEVLDQNFDDSIFVEKLIKAITGVKVRHYTTKELRNKAEDESQSIIERIQLLEKVLVRLEESDAPAAEKSAIVNNIIQLKNEEGRQENLEHSITLQRLIISDLLFFGKIEWTLDPRINILLSENGMGKTTLLRLLTIVLSHNAEMLRKEFENIQDIAKIKLEVQRGKGIVTTTYDTGILDGKLRTVPCFAISDMRHLSSNEIGIEEVERMEVQLVSESNERFIQKKLDKDRFATMIHILLDDYRKSEQHIKFADIPVFRLIEKILQNLLSESFHFVDKEKEKIKYLEVITPNGEKPVPLRQLSRGTNSVLYLFLSIWMHLRAVKEAKTELGVDTSAMAPHEIASIVIIDEIDAHLHPKWQRKIVDLLLDSFPNVQFIMASHSPLVVAGKTDGTVVSLKRSDQGVSLVPYRGNLIGETPNAIIEDVFAVTDLHEDRLYLKYGFLSDKKNIIQKKVEKLENQDALSEEEEELLDKHYEDLRKIEKYELVRNKIDTLNNSLFEIEKLESKSIKQEHEIGELKNKIISLERIIEELKSSRNGTN